MRPDDGIPPNIKMIPMEPQRGNLVMHHRLTEVF